MCDTFRDERTQLDETIWELESQMRDMHWQHVDRIDAIIAGVKSLRNDLVSDSQISEDSESALLDLIHTNSSVGS